MVMHSAPVVCLSCINVRVVLEHSLTLTLFLLGVTGARKEAGDSSDSFYSYIYIVLVVFYTSNDCLVESPSYYSTSG